MAGSQIRLDKLSHVRYQHPDLDKAHQFLMDFGLVPVRKEENRIYYRGFGEEQFVYIAEKNAQGTKHFVGGGWHVETKDDFTKATELPTAGVVLAIPEELGGGKWVDIKDPLGGVITLIFGQQKRLVKSSDLPEDEKFNSWKVKNRQGETHRPEFGPSKIHKLGHYGFEVDQSEYKPMLKWYMDTFNIVLTDSLYNPATNDDMMTFCHLDKGKEFVDHHSFFLAGGRMPKGVTEDQHCSFEVDDFDSQLVGHDWLKEKGHTSAYGVGRHLLGSQVFDYWFDPSGFILEHYCDGDQVNGETPHERMAAGPTTIAVWGPKPSLGFFAKNPKLINEPMPPMGPPPPPSPRGLTAH